MKKIILFIIIVLNINCGYSQTVLSTQTHYGGYNNLSTSYPCMGFSMEALETANVDSIILFLLRVGTVNEYFTVKIYAHTGTFGSNSKPTGSPLATSDSLYMGDVSTSTRSPIRFTFSGNNRISLEKGGYYVFMPHSKGATSTDYIRLGCSNSGDYPGNRTYSGNCSTGWGASNTSDMMHIIYGTEPTIAISKLNRVNRILIDTISALNTIPIDTIRTKNQINRIIEN